MNFSTTVLAFFMFLPGLASAQDKITIDDYNRAVGFMYENLNNKKVFNLNIQPNWFSLLKKANNFYMELGIVKIKLLI